MFAAVREQEQTRNKRKVQVLSEAQNDDTEGNSDCMSEEGSE